MDSHLRFLFHSFANVSPNHGHPNLQNKEHDIREVYHAYTSLVYGEHALKKACAYKQVFTGLQLLIKGQFTIFNFNSWSFVFWKLKSHKMYILAFLGINQSPFCY